MAGIAQVSTNGVGKDHWYELAAQEWLKPSTKARKVRADVVKNEIWDVLERENFSHTSLLGLEGLQLLESYLWPGYDEDSTNAHVLLIATLISTKARESLPTWDILADHHIRFSSFFRRVLALSLDTTLSANVRTLVLHFLVNAFQSLDNGLVRKECAPLVSISIWHNLASDAARERQLKDSNQLKKAWRASVKRYEAADDDGKARLRFERSWLHTLIVDFIIRLYGSGPEDVRYCEHFLEFISDLESQLPTRRYVGTLLDDMNMLPLIGLSPMFNAPDNGLIRDLYVLLRHFMNFPINDHTGAQYSLEESYVMHCESLARLQRIALKHFKDKLTLLALSNYGAIDQRGELDGHLQHLTHAELQELCNILGFRTTYPPASGIPTNRELLIEILLLAHERKKTFQETISNMSILPTERSLYEESLLRNETYDGSRPLAIPKLNLQYLTAGDFLWRSFILHRCEQFFEIRTYLEDTIKILRPTKDLSSDGVVFGHFSRMALPITKPAILEAAPAKVGYEQPAYVRAEITLNVSRLADNVRRDWDSLRPEDTIFLLAVSPSNDPRRLTNGHTGHNTDGSGISALRVAEVVQLLDENGRPVRDPIPGQVNGYGRRPHIRRLIVNLDAAAFQADSERKEKGTPDVYETMNLLVRRSKRENNFKKVLGTIRNLAVSEIVFPSWLQEVFLGFGDPRSVTYKNLPNRLQSVDLRDTFLDWQHLVESFPEKVIEPSIELQAGFRPPYVLISDTAPSTVASRPSKKRRRDEAEPGSQTASEPGVVKVSTYQIPAIGPYPSDAPRGNGIRFTPAQIEAIVSGTQPGLTVIVGPPGTGKTDVASQIISNIYHDFPSQRTLLIAHSNQALNQLFQKITRLSIDGRHLLRLGQGEGELETDESYSKSGRVESFLENRAFYLAEVDRLAASLGAPGAHGNSCETAGYFNLVYVEPAWHKFCDAAHSNSSSTSEIISCFPFHQYFHSAPQPLFPPGAPKDTILDIAHSCQRHIERIFTELEDIRPFEILRNNRDKTDYLMIKEARIIAMTSTHAAMRQQEIADLGFHYDNVVMEEAAQITEVENFIPLALQHPRNGELPLQRVILCGDHFQNSPVISNMAFRQFANLEQSLFLRLVRLGVPTIGLDAQGRARPSIAALYKWRYPKLGDLPNVLTDSEYLSANAGFRFEYQFIDVPDYKGRGETQPSPHFVQNLGEAEYAVAIYQYMRLLGYPASKISILTTYAGQRALIRDVLMHRCADNRLFGMPRIVTTVDKYQGEQNNYIILSLVRTTRPGYLRDLRRLTVALSRARLGLYILGRRSVFESAPEFTRAFELPLQRPANLILTTGEMFPTDRLLKDDAPATEMVGLEHLGQYVYEMTQAKVRMMKEGSDRLPPQEPEHLLDIDKEENTVRLAEEGVAMDDSVEEMNVDEPEDIM
ncbi:MAG: hypothetical protein Q9163_000358 [Psora crenata]